ncbi:RidA family protein [candidate division TA06 bacterium]|nr:RidA family protein [candidate division TA06 bacterium]
MGKEIIQTNKAPKAIGPYSQGIKVGDLLLTAGQIPIHPETGEIEEGDIRAQTERVMKNLNGVLEGAGGRMEDIVKTTVYMTDLKDFGEMNEVYGNFFQKDPPARSTVEVRNLPKGVKVEIDAIAYITS